MTAYSYLESQIQLVHLIHRLAARTHILALAVVVPANLDRGLIEDPIINVPFPRSSVLLFAAGAGDTTWHMVCGHWAQMRALTSQCSIAWKSVVIWWAVATLASHSAFRAAMGIMGEFRHQLFSGWCLSSNA